ncbi:hypothetical protein BGZ70_001688 [Mortierella alpina]|uniref:BTB domain-containing protein n=1 Tax=Mortierella alpina TaxID=64518 RepID=A0A9P6M518_MORAP|nr:hypothetical protein BGZ70_001688 [Mortierella alpina]
MTVVAASRRAPQAGLASSNAVFQIDTSPVHLKSMQHQMPYPQQPMPPSLPTQVSTKALAMTSSATKGAPPPPLMGSALVLVNDSALHCFGGRLENRELTNCHYVLDLGTHSWEAIHPAPILPTEPSTDGNETASSAASTPGSSGAISDTHAYLSLSLTTDPVNTSGSLSGEVSVPPPPRYFHTLNAFGTSLILFGGMGNVQSSTESEQDSSEESGEAQQKSTSSTTMAAMNDIHVFDILSQRWQQKHPSVNVHTPKPRWAHMATILDHYLVVIGGTDTAKAYVEDACVLDLHTWEWVASIQSIGQCGSYRTIAATGPSKQSSASAAPSSPSFPSSKISWPSTDSGPIDAMASISMVLSGRINTSTSTSLASQDGDSTANNTSAEITTSSPANSSGKHSGRLVSGELTPAFKTGKEVPSIYLYSNYNFQNLQRDFKVITPHYTHLTSATAAEFIAPSSGPTPPPSFSLVEKTQALSMMGHELPPGLRFPQGHVYQNQLILTGTLIIPGKAPTLAIYSFNLTVYKWERLATDSTLETGSWTRTLLHPATGALLIFGHFGANAETDYANRIQHLDHMIRIDLQAYGLYERPIPSLPTSAQELGQDLLANPSLSDMHVVSATGTLFGASSTMLAARWPEFSSLLLSPPYVTPLILVLPVPDEVVPIFLQYLYTGAVPSTIAAGIADYLLILAKRYDLKGLYALTMDILHQSIHLNPIRIYSSALMAGELGLQARAVGMALSQQAALNASPQYLAGAAEGRDLPPTPTSTNGFRRVSIALTRGSSTRFPPPSTKAPLPPSSHRRGASIQSRDSVSTDGGLVGEGLLQQYNGGQRIMPTMAQEDEDRQGPLFLSSPDPRQRKTRAAPLAPHSASDAQYQNAYPSPLSPSFQQHPFSSQSLSGVVGLDDYPHEDRTLQAKMRLQMQMQHELDPQQQQKYQRQLQEEYMQQQQLLFEQQHMKEQEMMVMEQHRLQQQRYVQRQQKLKQQQKEQEVPNPVAVLGALDYHFGGFKQPPAPSKIRATNDGVQYDYMGSGKSSGTSKGSSSRDKKEKGLFNKMKPPKPTISGADLMKSAGF